MQDCHRGHMPYPIYSTVISGANLPPRRSFRSKIPTGIVDILKKELKANVPVEKIKQKVVQTMFRESEAQTDPYEPDVLEPVDKSLEILTLGWLSYNNGLPARMREVIVIERARQRRAWEKALPLPYDNDAKAIRNMILEAIEVNEWSYREVELAVLTSLRMELAEKCMQELMCEESTRREAMVSNFASNKTEHCLKNVRKLNEQKLRNMRKLYMGQNKIERRYRRWNVTEELSNMTSEYFCPMMRFGRNPRYRNEEIPSVFHSWNVYGNLDLVQQSLKLMEEKEQKCDYNALSKPKKNQKNVLCLRETKWTEKNLENMFLIFKAIRTQRHKSRTPDRVKKRNLFLSTDITPQMVESKEDEEDLYQVSLLLQRVIKGRAVQMVLFEGRVKCQHLLEELKSTHAMKSHMIKQRAEESKRAYGYLRKDQIEKLKNRRKEEVLRTLEGKTVSEVLDHLSKEIYRLQRERVVHDLCLAADHDRHQKEAAEAGRRQKEEHNRRELDEIYKQICRVYQTSVDIVVDVFEKQMMEMFSYNKARKDAEELARKVDQKADESNFRKNDSETAAIIADLVHNFALPEVEKVLVRERLIARQKNYLTTCHDEIYSKIEKVAAGKRDSNKKLLMIPRPLKHKVPPLIPVKFVRLNRSPEMGDSPASSGSFSPFLKSDFWNEPSQSSKERDDDWSTGFSRQKVVIEANAGPGPRGNVGGYV